MLQEPIKEDIDACMHMLRHLDDPLALRRNALVAPLFRRARAERSPRRAFAQKIERVRTIVESAAEALRSDEAAGDAGPRDRQYQILKRCDLQRESRETVMRDLGISRRQFYRDRAAACGYVAWYVAEQLREVEPLPTFVVDLFEAGHERARALRYAGELDRSADALRDMIAQPVSARKKVLPWITLVELLNDDSRGEEASHELNEARRFAHAHTSVAAEQLQQLALVQEASVLWALGEEKKALDADEATKNELHWLVRCTDAPIAAAAIKSHLARAQRAFLLGDYRASQADITLAGELMDRCERLPLAHRLQYLLLDGDRKIFSPGEFRVARAPLAEVAGIAQAHGNLELLSIALGDMALIAQTYGDLDTAARHSRESLALSSRAPRGVRGHMLLNGAEIAAERGHSRDSIELATQAQRCFPERGLGASVSWYHVARGLLALRDYSGAREAAEKLRQNAALGGNPRLLGSGLRLLAQAYYGLDEVTKAHEHIDAAILVLERFGHPFALRAAYLSSAKITGRHEHRRMAGEITASFELSA
jgi:hypothetical protein